MAMRPPADPVAVFLRKNTFKCHGLGNARITPEQCVDRQLREVEVKYFGRKLTLNNSAFDRYCRSGCCEIGLVHLKKLNPAKHKERVQALREAKLPCHPLGEGTCTI